MWFMRKYILKRTDDQYISHKNNIAQLYFFREICVMLDFFQLTYGCPYRFSIVHMVKTHFLLENL